MITVNIATAKGFSPDELKKLHAAQNALNKILNHQSFKDRVLRFTTDGLYRFHYRKSFLGNWIDQPYSNQHVYDMITQNAQNPEDKKIELQLEMLPGGNVEQLGFTNPDTQSIYTYRNWLNSLPIAEYTSHLVHEWCHQLGFNHDKTPNDKTEFSVPFGIGKITERIAWEC
jgi:hypothetical protein